MMRPGQDLCVLVLCVFSIYWSCVLAARKYDKPEITSEFETVIETNDNHTVFCQGNDPLNWRWPEVEEEFQFWTTFITTRETPVDKNYKYGLRLQIINMTYPFVGFYYCHYENANLEDELNSAKIYLFVNDPDHLTLLKDNGAFNTYTVTQFTEAVIPCKPTSPDVQVLLLDYNDGKEIEDTTYDPKTGFTFFVSDLDQQQIYQCNFSRHSATAVILVFLTVEPYQYISDLPLPYIQDLNEGHTIVGKPLVLECIIKTRNQVFFHWSTPSGDINEKRMRTSSRGKTDKTYGVLTIANATKADNGTYSCNVTDNQDHSAYTSLDVRVFDINESFLSVKEENDVHSLTAPAGEDEVHWIIRVEGHPRPTVNWFNNRNTTIRMENDEKYQAYYNATYNTALLKIKKLAISDFGTYTLRVTNKKEEKILPLFLNVTDKPTVVIDTEPFYFINTPSKVKCIAYANPEPQFEWSFKPCLSRDCQFGPVEKIVTEGEGFVFTSVITISNATESGHIRCRARNSVGFNQAFKGFFVSDIKNGFDIIIKNSDVDVDEEQKVATVAEDETVSMACGAAKLNYSDIALFWNNQPLTNYYNTFSVTNSSTQYSTKLELELEHMNKSNSGSLSCRVKDKNGGYLYRNMTFTVATPVPPAIVNTTLKEKLEIDLAEKLVLYCRVSGIPKPSLLWYKNGVVFNPPESTRLKVSADNEKITFWPTLAQDEGTYRCEAKNKKGTAYKQQTVKFKNLPRAQGWLIIVIVLLSLVSVAAIIFIIIKTRKEKRLQRELKLLGLTNFQNGAVENINPELGIDDQAELLPYDQKWEFPIERLKLGKQLGSGAFGVVLKGVAKNIVEGEEQTTVAVKMVKKNTDSTYIRTLASELKIMVHLGKHLNVVNLLGACTKNVAKRELLVIVEYCRFGNLQLYLLRHRDNYIHQVDPNTGKIDYTIGQEYFDRTYSVSSDRSNPAHSPSLKYAALTFSNSNQAVLPPASNMGDYRANNSDGPTATDMTTISQGEEGVTLSNNSVQPEWRSNYKGDYKGNVKPICTKDLLIWAFQVARGMEYLASRKVLHGDLAARNILLADNNIVKICDFGLAKSMYKKDIYQKGGNALLPVKWMAIESIRDRIFSTQSDVWSFGIVLWEFFSLARTPYPGMAADERLYQKLVDGYRMESPQYAPREVYRMMTECWATKPLARPSFTKLVERLGTLMDDTLKKYYIELNDPYLVMNTQRLQEGQSDYLAMLSPPTFEAICSPHYVNDVISQESLEDSGYLSMKPNTIFSPRVEEGEVFDFNVNNRKNTNSTEGNTMELVPMLQRRDSGCETPLQSPATPNSVSNPSYHLPPNIPEEDRAVNTDIVKSPDNYVNMLQSKSIVKEKNSGQINPFADSNNGNGNLHYVNCS